MTTISFEVEDELEKSFNFLSKELGVSTTAVFKMFMRKVVSEHSLPFEIKENVMTREERRAEIKRLTRLKTGKYIDFDNPEDVKEFFDD